MGHFTLKLSVSGLMLGLSLAACKPSKTSSGLAGRAEGSCYAGELQDLGRRYSDLSGKWADLHTQSMNNQVEALGNCPEEGAIKFNRCDAENNRDRTNRNCGSERDIAIQGCQTRNRQLVQKNTTRREFQAKLPAQFQAMQVEINKILDDMDFCKKYMTTQDKQQSFMKDINQSSALCEARGAFFEPSTQRCYCHASSGTPNPPNTTGDNGFAPESNTTCGNIPPLSSTPLGQRMLDIPKTLPNTGTNAPALPQTTVSCPSGQIANSKGVCVSTYSACKTGYYMGGDGRCYLQSATACTADQYLGLDGKCHPSEGKMGTATECPAGQVLTTLKTCEPDGKFTEYEGNYQ